MIFRKNKLNTVPVEGQSLSSGDEVEFTFKDLENNTIFTTSVDFFVDGDAYIYVHPDETSSLDLGEYKYDIEINGSSFVADEDVELKEETWQPSEYFGHEDFNRVEEKIEAVANHLRFLGTQPFVASVVKDRTYSYIDTVNDANRIELQIDKLKTGFPLHIDYNSKKEWKVEKNFDYEDVEKWDEDLNNLYKWSINAHKSYKYAGEFYCGEDVVL